MGHYFMDTFSYLHFAVGVVTYFWGITFKNLLIIHIIFELLENSQFGINFINKVIYFWPGGKQKPDTLINQFGDILFSLLGWLSALYLNKLTKKYQIDTSSINTFQ